MCGCLSQFLQVYHEKLVLSGAHSYDTDEETEAQKPVDSPTGSQAASAGPGLEVRWLDSCRESQYYGSPSSPLTTLRAEMQHPVPRDPTALHQVTLTVMIKGLSQRPGPPSKHPTAGCMHSV